MVSAGVAWITGDKENSERNFGGYPGGVIGVLIVGVRG